jgi:hypothetical protein
MKVFHKITAIFSIDHLGMMGCSFRLPAAAHRGPVQPQFAHFADALNARPVAFLTAKASNVSYLLSSLLKEISTNLGWTIATFRVFVTPD